MKLWLEDNYIVVYSKYEEKSFVAERFIRASKNKIHNYVNSVSKMCILIN